MKYAVIALALFATVYAASGKYVETAKATHNDASSFSTSDLDRQCTKAGDSPTQFSELHHRLLATRFGY